MIKAAGQRPSNFPLDETTYQCRIDASQDFSGPSFYLGYVVYLVLDALNGEPDPCSEVSLPDGTTESHRNVPAEDSVGLEQAIEIASFTFRAVQNGAIHGKAEREIQRERTVETANTEAANSTRKRLFVVMSERNLGSNQLA